jgi:hypothetical protein
MQTSTRNRPIPHLDIQACITSVSFPTTLDGLREMLQSNVDYGRPALDMDGLPRFDPNKGALWTAPRWLLAGDLMFLYHTKSAKGASLD